jgi:hypothetical protein
MSNRYYYEIDNNNVVRAWDNEFPNSDVGNAPFLLQDIHPDGRPWLDKQEAEDWIKAQITEKENIDNE